MVAAVAVDMVVVRVVMEAVVAAILQEEVRARAALAAVEEEPVLG
jgi:hypothetical protein